MSERPPKNSAEATEAPRGIERAIADPVGAFLDHMPYDIDVEVASSIDLSYLTPAQRAESLWAVYQNVKDARHTEGAAHEKLAEDKKFLLGLALLRKLYDDPETNAAYGEGYARHKQETRTLNGDLERYQDLEKKLKDSEGAFDAAARNIFGKRGSSGPDEIDSLIFESNRQSLERARAELEKLTANNPDLAALAEHRALKDYARDLREREFAWTPSRRELLEKIELAALSGRPMLISGESGSGKTRLVQQAAITLTGRLSAETPGKDVRFQTLIAERDIATDGSTYYRYKEIGEAATGKETTADPQPKHSGRIVADDEFNLLPSAEQTERLARIESWKPGKRVRMPVTNEEVTIGTDFLYCAMVNLASERYERKKIPPEVLRKFSKVDVDYLPQTETEPELYEVMLAALMDSQGRIRAALPELSPLYEDKEEMREVQKLGQTVKATVRTRELVREIEEGGATIPAGGFLWRFAQALNELNKSFSHEETVLKAKGEGQYLKDFVLDIGKVTGWLREFQAAGKSSSLEAFIIEKINSQFLETDSYSKEDRKLLKEFLAHFNIDTDKQFEEEDRPEFQILTPKDIGLLSPRVKYTKIVEQQPVLKEAYILDEGGRRVEYRIEAYEHGGTTYEPGEIITQRGRDFEFKGVNKKTGEPVLVPFKKRAEPRAERRQGLSVERAKEIMGRGQFQGPEEVALVWGSRPSPEQIPAIPFSAEELERAKELGQVLRLRVDKDPSGQPLTMQRMLGIQKPKFDAAGDGKVLFNVDWYKDENFYKTEAPRAGWVLTSREFVPQTTSKNYLQQTEALVEHLTATVLQGRSPSPEYVEAIEEFTREKAGIQAILSSDWQKASEKLANLKITKLLRSTEPELMYDAMMDFGAENKKRILESTYGWSATRSSGGYLVGFGSFDAVGAGVSRWKPGGASDGLGALFSRRI